MLEKSIWVRIKIEVSGSEYSFQEPIGKSEGKVSVSKEVVDRAPSPVVNLPAMAGTLFDMAFSEYSAKAEAARAEAEAQE